MAINYSVKKKVFKSKEGVKELYFAVPKAVQPKGESVDERDLALQMEHGSSLSAGDVLSVLELLSRRIVDNLQDGRTVNIRGLGTFFVGLSSEGVSSPEECTADKVRVTRICFKADKELSKRVKHTKFFSIELKEAKKE